MNYASWCSNEEMLKHLKKVNIQSKIEKSGIPIMYDKSNGYIYDQDGHTLIIGSTGSGKTQAMIFPSTKLAILAGESMLINDQKGEVYQTLSGELKEKNYQTIVIDLKSANKGNYFNPLMFPYNIYKNNPDEALELIENIGITIFTDEKHTNGDQFWINSAKNYFVGLVLYLFEHAKKEEINLNSVWTIGNEIIDDKELLNKMNKNSDVYLYLSAIILAPTDTKGSILSVFNQKLSEIIGKQNLSLILSKSDFDFENINKGKTAIFVISGEKYRNNIILPILINQVCTLIKLKNTEKRFNIILDGFETLKPIKNFDNLLSYSRGINIKFIVLTRSLYDLLNAYGKEEIELIKMNFGPIIYLMGNDSYTLETISDYCGKANSKEQLISVEQLKTLKMFEAIVLIPRIMPFKTKLVPDYQIDWQFNKNPVELPTITREDIKIYPEK